MPTRDSISPATKRRFRVTAESADWFHIDIFAKDEDEAREIAEHVDGGSWRATNDGLSGTWEIQDVQEVPDGKPFDPLDERCYGTLWPVDSPILSISHHSR